MKQLTWGGKRANSGREKLPEKKKRQQLRLNVAYKTRQKILRQYGLKGFAAWLDKEFE